MRHWDQESRAEFELAVENAWNRGRNVHERTEAFIEAVQDAEQAHRDWAVEILTVALRDGMWKRLKDYRKSLEPMIVAFAHSEHNVPSVGGVVRRTEDGALHEQLELVDMTREQLLEKQRECDTTMFATRRRRFVYGRLVELIDRAENASTARQAAAELGTDVATYLAVDEQAS
jgi:hypothetical protein